MRNWAPIILIQFSICNHFSFCTTAHFLAWTSSSPSLGCNVMALSRLYVPSTPRCSPHPVWALVPHCGPSLCKDTLYRNLRLWFFMLGNPHGGPLHLVILLWLQFPTSEQSSSPWLVSDTLCSSGCLCGMPSSSPLGSDSHPGPPGTHPSVLLAWIPTLFSDTSRLLD